MALSLSKTFAAMTTALMSDLDVVFNEIKDFINDSLDAAVVKDSAKVGGFTPSKTPAIGEVVVVNDDGTIHADLTGTVSIVEATGLAFTGQFTGAAVGYGNSSYIDVDLGAVTAGDTFFVQAQFDDTYSVPPTVIEPSISQISGTAAIAINISQTFLNLPWNLVGSNARGAASGIFWVTTGGTLVLRFIVSTSDGTLATVTGQVFGFFLHKA